MEVYAIVESPLLNALLQVYGVLFGITIVESPLLSCSPWLFIQLFLSCLFVVPCISMSPCGISFMNMALILGLISQNLFCVVYEGI